MFDPVSRVITVNALVVGCMLMPVTDAEARKWCGTESGGWRGTASKFIPENYPPQKHTPLCPGRRADIVHACIKHDLCYWNKNYSKQHCDNQFEWGIKHECLTFKKPYRVAGKKWLPSTCIGMYLRCLKVAKLYTDVMVSQQGRSFSDARSQASKVEEILKQRLGQDVFARHQQHLYDMIGMYCAHHARRGSCKVHHVVEVIELNFRCENPRQKRCEQIKPPFPR